MFGALATQVDVIASTEVSDRLDRLTETEMVELLRIQRKMEDPEDGESNGAA
jgi:hypothetical protein